MATALLVLAILGLAGSVSAECPIGSYFQALPPAYPPPPYPPPTSSPPSPGTPPPSPYPPSSPSSPPYPPSSPSPPPASPSPPSSLPSPPPPYPPPSSIEEPLPPTCQPCPSGYTTANKEAMSVDQCVPCPEGETSSGRGGACFVLVVPEIDLTIQRDIELKFDGPNFQEFLAKGPAYTKSFNDTVVEKILDYSPICQSVWLFKWFAGSIVTNDRLTYPSGTSQEDMDADSAGIVANAATVFGDSLIGFGVTGFGQVPQPDDDDDDNALAIGLGVGLGVGIPLIAGIIFFCIWKKRKDDQTVAPAGASA